MGIFSPLLDLCEGNTPVTGGFPSQRPVTRSFDVFFDLRLNKRLSKQSGRRLFETPSRSLWRHCDVKSHCFITSILADKPFKILHRERSVQGDVDSQFSPFHLFPEFSALSKHTLDIAYHICIWQVSPQLSCGDTYQIWMGFKEFNRYFWKIESFSYGEINERSFSNPTSGVSSIWLWATKHCYNDAWLNHCETFIQGNYFNHKAGLD